jgi:glycosyltransferase involved in cell wall biosynthesis
VLLQQRYSRRGQVVPSLCPFHVVERLAHESRGSLLWVARVDNWKQPELFIKLAEQMPDQSFVMVVMASHVNPGQMQMVQQAVDGVPNLKLVQSLPLDEATRLFREAAVFVNTSRAEGFPNTFLQAAASGTPIVSWAVDPDHVLERYEMGFCAREDWSRFEQSIRLLSRDIALRTKMGENGQRYVRERHDPAAIAQVYMEIFSALKSGDVPGSYRDLLPVSSQSAGISIPTESIVPVQTKGK